MNRKMQSVSLSVPKFRRWAMQRITSSMDNRAAPPASPFQIDTAQNTFENGFYRIKFDPSTGAIRSILDKHTQKELVRQGGKYQCNELVGWKMTTWTSGCT